MAELALAGYNQDASAQLLMAEISGRCHVLQIIQLPEGSVSDAMFIAHDRRTRHQRRRAAHPAGTAAGPSSPATLFAAGRAENLALAATFGTRAKPPPPPSEPACGASTSGCPNDGP